MIALSFIFLLAAGVAVLVAAVGICNKPRHAPAFAPALPRTLPPAPPAAPLCPCCFSPGMFVRQHPADGRSLWWCSSWSCRAAFHTNS